MTEPNDQVRVEWRINADAVLGIGVLIYIKGLWEGRGAAYSYFLTGRDKWTVEQVADNCAPYNSSLRATLIEHLNAKRAELRFVGHEELLRRLKSESSNPEVG